MGNELMQLPQGWEPPRHTVRRNTSINPVLQRIWKRHGVAVMIVGFMAVWTFGTCGTTALVVKHNTAIEVREQMEMEAEQERARLAEEAMMQEAEDPYLLQLNAEAELVAQVLYGVRDNNTDDLRTYCWCIFNRVDNSRCPSTLEDVIAQPDQWMRYHPTNPILEDLYQIAREELDRWHTDTHRPVSNEYVFMTWSSNSIVLRDNFHEGSNTHYWRYKQ